MNSLFRNNLRWSLTEHLATMAAIAIAGIYAWLMIISKITAALLPHSPGAQLLVFTCYALFFAGLIVFFAPDGEATPVKMKTKAYRPATIPPPPSVPFSQKEKDLQRLQNEALKAWHECNAEKSRATVEWLEWRKKNDAIDHRHRQHPEHDFDC